MNNLPPEIIYSIFKYLHKEHIAYAFLELNNYFSCLTKYFLGQEFDFTRINDPTIVQYCLSIMLPSIGSNLRYLSIGYPYHLRTYLKSIQIYCTNLDTLHIYCCSNSEDIRLYIIHLLDYQIESLHFLVDNQIVGEQISYRLLNKFFNEHFSRKYLSSTLFLHLLSFDDLLLLERYCNSSYLSDGLYMIECVSNGELLTDTKDDLCIMSKNLHGEHIFSIRQTNAKDNLLEYELINEQTQKCLSVLICNEDEEYWMSSSVFSTRRKQSNRSCSRFIFEKIDDNNHYYIRPCYAYAKRLQIQGKRIIISRCDNENILNHCFRLHHIV